jgi:hypothetical protein
MQVTYKQKQPMKTRLTEIEELQLIVANLKGQLLFSQAIVRKQDKMLDALSRTLTCAVWGGKN